MTTVHISEENWRKINSLKQPGESVDDVVTRILRLTGLNDPDITEDLEFEELLDRMMEVEHDLSSPTLEEIIEKSRKGWKIE